MTTEPARSRCLDLIIWWTAAVALAVLAWWPLLRGAGLIGGDIYTYFFPLKLWYAWWVKRGSIPFWNALVGHGFPTLGESQTAIFYPSNLILYRFLSVNMAYNLTHVAHYVLAFGFTCLLASAMGLGRWGACFAALVLVYGWFPARSCLEWAAVTGAWLPAVLWAAMRYMQTGRLTYWLALQVAVALQLLAGHYHLAFVTCLALGAVLAFRFAWWRPAMAARMVSVLVALVAGGLISSAQLLSTWELKQRSHRAEAVFLEREITYGAVPLPYLAQTVMPWRFYPKMHDPSWRSDFFGRYYTNQAEAHLYFGYPAMLLALAALLRRRNGSLLLLGMTLVAGGIVLATGILVPVLKHLPGFGYFTGPGRYGLLAQLGIALLAGHQLDALWRGIRTRLARAGGLTLLFGASWFEYTWVAAAVQIAGITLDPPIDYFSRGLSPLQSVLPTTVRVLGKSENALTLLGLSQLPAYIGLSPREYLDGPGAIPFRWNKPPTERVLRWLDWAGVEYVVTAEPLPFLSRWPVEIIWHAPDPFVAQLLGAARQEPVRVYRIKGARGRAYLVPANTPSDRLEPYAKPPERIRPVQWLEIRANEVEILVRADEPSLLVLTDLMYPGWSVLVDGKPARPVTASMFRAVHVPAGQHTVVWRYRPTWLATGLWLAAVVLGSDVALVLAGLARRRRHGKEDSAGETQELAA